MDTTKTSSENIAEAFKLLEEAAKQKKDELKSVMSDKYTHLRNAIVETEHGLARSISEAKKHAIDAAVRAKDVTVVKTREIAGEVDESVHRNPWSYIGGAAVISLLLGFVLGKGRK